MAPLIVKVKENFCMITIVLFCILQTSLDELKLHCYEDLLLHVISGP
jgi:hypothetical protein